MSEIELFSGTIEYEDTGGDGPTIVMLHGLMMDASLWDGPIAELLPTTDAWHRPCRLAPIVER
jgi:pimeloyl-ACP methyl ester carboxylesterase